jgi:hypothetical protein
MEKSIRNSSHGLVKITLYTMQILKIHTNNILHIIPLSLP